MSRINCAVITVDMESTPTGVNTRGICVNWGSWTAAVHMAQERAQWHKHNCPHSASSGLPHTPGHKMAASISQGCILNQESGARIFVPLFPEIILVHLADSDAIPDSFKAREMCWIYCLRSKAVIGFNWKHMNWDWGKVGLLLRVILSQKRKSGDFPGFPVVKNSHCNAEDTSSIPGRRTEIPHAEG